MNWKNHNIKFIPSESSIEDMVHKDGTRWSPAQGVEHSLHDLLTRLAAELRQATGAKPLLVKVNKGGLALRGRGTSDFCWIDITRHDVVVHWNDNLFINQPMLMREQIRHEKCRVKSSDDVSAALEFCLRADGLVSGLNAGNTGLNQRPATPLPAPHLSSRKATRPIAESVTAVMPLPAVSSVLPDIRQVCSALYSAMVNFAESRSANGITAADIVMMPNIGDIPSQSRREALAMLCKDGTLVEENERYYLATPPHELICCETGGDTVPTPDRIRTMVSRIVRDNDTVRRLKKLYGYRCQICGYRLSLPTSLYAEVHHLQPLGTPHNGLDVLENMIVVCPNHHVLLDYGAVTVSVPGLKYARHQLGDTFIRYHNQIIRPLSR